MHSPPPTPMRTGGTARGRDPAPALRSHGPGSAAARRGVHLSLGAIAGRGQVDRARWVTTIDLLQSSFDYPLQYHIHKYLLVTPPMHSPFTEYISLSAPSLAEVKSIVLGGYPDRSFSNVPSAQLHSHLHAHVHSHLFSQSTFRSRRLCW